MFLLKRKKIRIIRKRKKKDGSISMEDKRSPKEEKERRERNKKQIKTQSNLFKK